MRNIRRRRESLDGEKREGGQNIKEGRARKRKEGTGGSRVATDETREVKE